MNWDIVIIIVCILLGLLFVLLEVLIVPGGIVGIIGAGVMVYGVYLAYDVFGIVGGSITLTITVMLVVFGLIYAIRNKTWRKVSLQEEIKGKSGVNMDISVQVGDTGRSISRLSPMGKARFDNQVYEVSTRGEFIDEEQAITITGIKDQRIYVKQNN